MLKRCDNDSILTILPDLQFGVWGLGFRVRGVGARVSYPSVITVCLEVQYKTGLRRRFLYNLTKFAGAKAVASSGATSLFHAIGTDGFYC